MLRSLKWAIAITMVFGFSASASAMGLKEDNAGKCPISGNAAKADATAEHKGKTVNFCCNGCVASFKKDPEKYTAKVNHQWASTGKIVQVACPLTGRPVNADAKVDVNGVEVKFCCNGCKGKAEKAEDKVNLVFANISKGYTMQDTCPVSGRKIDVEKSTTHNGKNVYFCCEGCAAKFKAEPAKFEAKLPKE